MVTRNLRVAQWSVNEYQRMITSVILNERKVELLAGEIIEIYDKFIVGARH